MPSVDHNQVRTGHRTVTYISPAGNRSFQQPGSRSHSTSMTTTMRHQNSQQEVVDRSRSRSATRTASENLLVSLDEAVLPPQITINKTGTTAATSTTINSARVMRRGGDDGGLLYEKSPSRPRQFGSVETAAQGPIVADTSLTTSD